MNRFHRWFCRTAWWKKHLESQIIPWALEGLELGDNVLEVGPGPGLTTDLLRQRLPRLTAIEIDPSLADSLALRLQGTNVKVIEGDATAMPFADNLFSGAVSFTMLHHVPSSVLQDRLLAEVHRVLKPGSLFVGTDSRWSIPFHLIHLKDTMVMVEPETFAERLEAAGFHHISVVSARNAFRFRARRL
ncbi:MAG: class I SAM-dependent methyltransferase [Acidobacteria bacterium]|nr:class I SAM-dependent methyltransferase [Acidobacteriota bacterium]